MAHPLNAEGVVVTVAARIKADPCLIEEMSGIGQQHQIVGRQQFAHSNILQD